MRFGVGGVSYRAVTITSRKAGSQSAAFHSAGYADLLRRDAEAYFIDVERYFRCLDPQRREVFEQAHVASEDYARVLELQRR